MIAAHAQDFSDAHSVFSLEERSAREQFAEIYRSSGDLIATCERYGRRAQTLIVDTSLDWKGGALGLILSSRGLVSAFSRDPKAQFICKPEPDSLHEAVLALGTLNIRSGGSRSICSLPDTWIHSTGGLKHWGDVSKSLTRADARPGIDRAACLARIQASFGFQLGTLARVLRISRAQLYKWMDASRAIALQGSSRQRLAIVQRLAEKWSALTTKPLAQVLRGEADEGGSLMELLKTRRLNEVAVGKELERLSQSAGGELPSASQMLRERGFHSRFPRALPSDD